MKVTNWLSQNGYSLTQWNNIFLHIMQCSEVHSGRRQANLSQQYTKPPCVEAIHTYISFTTYFLLIAIICVHSRCLLFRLNFSLINCVGFLYINENYLLINNIFRFIYLLFFVYINKLLYFVSCYLSTSTFFYFHESM